MLEIPFADDDRVFDGLGLPEGEAALYEYAWHPRLVLLPTWRLDGRARLLKRLIDLCFALSGLIALAMPALLIAMAIRLGSAGPILFRQKRIGLAGRKFTAFKFRTMYWNPEASLTLKPATRWGPR